MAIINEQNKLKLEKEASEQLAASENTASNITFKARDEAEAVTLESLQQSKTKKNSKSNKIFTLSEPVKPAIIASLVASINEAYKDEPNRRKEKNFAEKKQKTEG